MIRVFVSSTSRDLTAYRQAVCDAIDHLDGFHSVSMKQFGARDAPIHDFNRARVQECQLFLGIVGHLHGSCPEGSAQSYTELEFAAAVEGELPRLMFLASDDFPLAADLRESDEKNARQGAFRRRVTADRLPAPFSTINHLLSLVIESIRNWERTQGAAAISPRSLPSWAAAIPAAPEPYVAHPFALQPHFTGRATQRRALTDWYVRGAEPVFVLDEMGGMGKSSLAWVWLHEDVLGTALTAPGSGTVAPCGERPEGVLWWSFYHPDSDLDKFLREALVYFSSGRLNPDGVKSSYDRARYLAALLQQRRALVVLDGFERMLNAYGGLGAGYQGDAPARGHADGSACISRDAGRLLGWLTSPKMATRVLITSRLFPRDLHGADGTPLAGCRRRRLEGLEPEDARRFFDASGVHGTRAEVHAVCRAYGHHPLTLRLLCGYVRHHLADPGNLAVALGVDFVERLAHEKPDVLMLAYLALDQPTRDLLSHVAAFRSQVDFTGIQSVSSLTAESLHAAVRELLDRGLLQQDLATGRFDLHPIVRHYAYGRLTDKSSVHRRLTTYFATVAEPAAGEAITIEGLAPVIELFQHLVRSGSYREAEVLYRERLDAPLFSLGGYQEVVACIELILSEGGAPLCSHGMWVDLSISYGYLGFPSRAAQMLAEKALLFSRMEQEGAYYSVVRSQSYFSLALGKLAEADALLSQLSHGGLHPEELAYHHMRRGLLLTYRGDFESARRELAEVQPEPPTSRPAGDSDSDKLTSHLFCYRAIRAEMMGDPELARVCALRASRFALDLRQRVRSTFLLARASCLLADHATAERRRLLSHAEELIGQAMEGCRRSLTVELEIDVLLASSLVAERTGMVSDAVRDASEALAIAARCGYRLRQADAHLQLARLYRAEGKIPTSRQHAAKARERAFCDGPPHCYAVALAQADQLLA